jgi:type I restriction-modification system DNA methylase subunit
MPHKEALDNLEACIRFAEQKGHSRGFYMLLDWLLYGFGTSYVENIDHIDKDLSDYWYTTFNLGLLLKYPYDYFGYFTEMGKGNGKYSNPNAFFRTPAHVAKMIVDMTMTEADKTKGVNDPCCGSGIFLLYASNHSLNLHGQDIAVDMCKCCLANAWLYMPSLAFIPEGFEIKGLTDKKEEAVNFQEVRKLGNLLDFAINKPAPTIKS